MKKILSSLLVGLIVSVGILGCGSGDAGKATEEDKANLDRLTKEGLQTGPPPAATEAPKSVSGEVDAP